MGQSYEALAQQAREAARAREQQNREHARQQRQQKRRQLVREVNERLGLRDEYDIHAELVAGDEWLVEVAERFQLRAIEVPQQGRSPVWSLYVVRRFPFRVRVWRWLVLAWTRQWEKPVGSGKRPSVGVWTWGPSWSQQVGWAWHPIHNLASLEPWVDG